MNKNKTIRRGALMTCANFPYPEGAQYDQPRARPRELVRAWPPPWGRIPVRVNHADFQIGN
jgi:hypothetical protein